MLKIALGSCAVVAICALALWGGAAFAERFKIQHWNRMHTLAWLMPTLLALHAKPDLSTGVVLVGLLFACVYGAEEVEHERPGIEKALRKPEGTHRWSKK